jgi:hypothetical protein
MVARLVAEHGRVVDADCQPVWVRVDYAPTRPTPRPAAAATPRLE